MPRHYLDGKNSRVRISHSTIKYRSVANSSTANPSQHVDTKRGSAEGKEILFRWPACTHCAQILQEIGQKKAFAEQQLVIVRQQKVANSRESRMLQLTGSEMESLPKETKVYEGVGKMYVVTICASLPL